MVDDQRELARPDGPVPFHFDPAIGAVGRFQMLNRTLQVIGHGFARRTAGDPYYMPADFATSKIKSWVWCLAFFLAPRRSSARPADRLRVRALQVRNAGLCGQQKRPPIGRPLCIGPARLSSTETARRCIEVPAPDITARRRNGFIPFQRFERTPPFRRCARNAVDDNGDFSPCRNDHAGGLRRGRAVAADPGMRKRPSA